MATGRILVVDPRDAELERTAAMLRDRSFRVASLSRPEAALTLYDVFRPDAVVLGAQAPEAAILLARRLRQRSAGTLPTFILLDAPTAELRRRCLERGHAVDVLPGACDGADLAARIRSQLQLKEAVERAARGDLRTPTLHDALTGIYNRRFLLALTSHEMRRCERYGGGFSLVACALKGVEGFKKEFGRDRADRLLVYTATLLCQTARGADVVARVGEDEFALLLPGASSEQLPCFLARLSSRIELARFQLDGRAVRPQVALGSVSFPDVVGTAPRLLVVAFQESRRPRSFERASGSVLGV